MTVISVPLRVRLATSLLYLSIPLIAFEVIIATRSPWWKLPYRNMGYWSLAFALICIPLSAWIVNAKRWAIQISGGLAACWIISSIWVAIRMRYPALGFFSIFLLGFFTIIIPWLDHETKRSFFDPKLHWYQGLPKPIPGLKCRLTLGDRSADLRVSRIDKNGVFVFSAGSLGNSGDRSASSSVLSSLLERKKLSLAFQFKDRQLACSGRPILKLGQGSGAGIQFIGLTSDQKKDIGDFVEILVGEGYV